MITPISLSMKYKLFLLCFILNLSFNNSLNANNLNAVNVKQIKIKPIKQILKNRNDAIIFFQKEIEDNIKVRLFFIGLDDGKYFEIKAFNEEKSALLCYDFMKFGKIELNGNASNISIELYKVNYNSATKKYDLKTVVFKKNILNLDGKAILTGKEMRIESPEDYLFIMKENNKEIFKAEIRSETCG